MRADVAGRGDACCDPLAVLQLSASRVRERGLHVDVQGPETASLRTPMPAEDLETVFGNLLDNIRLHAPGSPARIEAAITDHRLVLSFSDDGPGISAANAAQVFDPFFTTARNAGSTGLGMPIVRALLTASGGDIRLEAATAGTRVVVTLPLLPP